MTGYWLFHGDHYYPLGGFADHHQHFTTIEEAQAARDKIASHYTWTQIVNAETGEIIEHTE